MTEAEWLAASDSANMVSALFLVENLPSEISKRRLLLFAAACCRLALNQIEAVTCRLAVEVAESFIEGEATREQVSERQSRVNELKWSQPQSQRPFWFAVSSLCEMDGWQAAEDASAPMSDSLQLRSPASIILRCTLGNPFRPVAFDPSWRTEAVVALARGMYESRDFAPMPVLADALDDAGCGDADILAHCRGPGPHVRGCWVVDLVLGKS